VHSGFVYYQSVAKVMFTGFKKTNKKTKKNKPQNNKKLKTKKQKKNPASSPHNNHLINISWTNQSVSMVTLHYKVQLQSQFTNSLH